MSTLADLIAVYRGSNGDVTRALYERLEHLGPAGAIAVNLLRACKTTERAKRYRGRSTGALPMRRRTGRSTISAVCFPGMPV